MKESFMYVWDWLNGMSKKQLIMWGVVGLIAFQVMFGTA